MKKTYEIKFQPMNSFAIYTTREEADTAEQAIEKARKVWRRTMSEYVAENMTILNAYKVAEEPEGKEYALYAGGEDHGHYTTFAKAELNAERLNRRGKKNVIIMERNVSEWRRINEGKEER